MLDIDPEGVEAKVINNLVNFVDRDILEIGCGNGRMTWGYANAANSVLALDSDGTAITEAMKCAKELGLGNVSFRVGDITHAELPNNAFDVVVFAWSM